METWLDLTEGFPIRFDVERMKSDLARFENSEAWLTHYDRGLSGDWRAILLKSKNGEISGPESQRPSWDFSNYRRTKYVDELPYFREIMDQLKCPQGRMRVLRLAPGMEIALHSDIGAEVSCLAFKQVRLHVPIVTNDRVTFLVGGEKIKMQPGRVYYANFAKPHCVKNDGAEPRTHLVMDVQVNDWLAQYFPQLTLWEQLEFAWARAVWPWLWVLRRWKQRGLGLFWRHYEGSQTQALVHRIRGKSHAAA